MLFFEDIVHVPSCRLHTRHGVKSGVMSSVIRVWLSG